MQPYVKRDQIISNILYMERGCRGGPFELFDSGYRHSPSHSYKPYAQTVKDIRTWQ